MSCINYNSGKYRKIDWPMLSGSIYVIIIYAEIQFPLALASASYYTSKYIKRVAKSEREVEVSSSSVSVQDVL